MKNCRFPGMTPDQYDRNMNALKTLVTSHGGLLRRIKLRTKVDDSGMYRAVERRKTGTREAARRVRQTQRDRGA